MMSKQFRGLFFLNNKNHVSWQKVGWSVVEMAWEHQIERHRNCVGGEGERGVDTRCQPLSVLVVLIFIFVPLLFWKNQTSGVQAGK